MPSQTLNALPRVSTTQWLVEELQRRLEGTAPSDTVKIRSAVGLYMRIGYSVGMDRKELEDQIQELHQAHEVACNLPEIEITQGKPPPAYRKGQIVEVVLNERNKTYRKGTIIGFGWHDKNRHWMFSIESGGKRVSKRYTAQDLRATEA